MTDTLTISGIIATQPEFRLVGTENTLARISFRLATAERRKDDTGAWRDLHTNWYTITAFSRLAENCKDLLRKGQHVLVSGKLRIREYERADKTTGTNIDITAQKIGIDLSFTGTAPRDEASAQGKLPRESAAASAGRSATGAAVRNTTETLSPAVTREAEHPQTGGEWHDTARDWHAPGVHETGDGGYLPTGRILEEAPL